MFLTPILFLTSCGRAVEPTSEPILFPVDTTTEIIETVEIVKVVEKVEIVAPIDQVQPVGSVPETTPPVVESEVVPEQLNLGEFKLTAYCSCQTCCGYWATVRPLDENGNPIVYTASGAVAEAGKTIAVDTAVIAHGSVVEINGHRYVAQDTGSSIVGNRIDIYFDDHNAALDFGVQYADVLLIKE